MLDADDRKDAATTTGGTAGAPVPESAPSFAEPTPAEVKREFARLREEDPSGEAALAYLYREGIDSGYIVPDTDRTIRWNAPSPYGTLEISINRAKPEKDPAAIAAAVHADRGRETANANAEPSGTEHADASRDAIETNTDPDGLTGGGCDDSPHIPACDLCLENEGFAGAPGHPAKPHLRIAEIPIGDETWGLQFSPYGYFNEHCIAIAPEHRPMKIDSVCIDRLLDFVDLFPGYFIGSNADLPIVGGSILSHDHFQGGRHRFALMDAPVETPVELSGHPDVEAGIVAWPASVLRLRSADREALAAAAKNVLNGWLAYDDPQHAIYNGPSASDGARHNTLNPIAYRDSDGYVLDLALRNNAVDDAHPWGIYHPDASLHHIKKENIGLIEIMGLAILPGRLEADLAEGRLTRKEIDGAYPRILEATGVFKQTPEGRAGWKRFLSSI